MKVLVLEDDPQRMVLIHELLKGHDVHHIDSAFAEIDPSYDLYLLDHDLGGRQIEDHEDCGTAFVEKHLEQLRKGIVIIHSYNVARGLQMCETIGGKNCAYCPFGGIVWKVNIQKMKEFFEKQSEPTG
jgi:hypothetical protein